MNEYLEKGKEVLKILINNGCEAYMIGEAVHNLIRGAKFDSIDITTNATPDMVKGIFANAKVEDYFDGAVELTYMGYTFIIRTFRLQEKYKDDRTPIRRHYSKNLKDELAACDFTINALAMSYGGKVTDAYRGYEDLKRKRIKTIGSAKVRFVEDPLRMLIAIRMASELGFRIERKTFAAMKKRRKHLRRIEPSLMEIELRRIFNGKYFRRALTYLVEAKLHRYIKDLQKGLKYLRNNYKRLSIDSILACSYVLEKGYKNTWDNLVEDPARLKDVVELALLNPKSRYNPELLFKYGLEVCLDSNYVNYMLRKSRNRVKRINKQFASLPIKEMNDLNFSETDFNNLSIGAYQYYDIIIKDVINKILIGEMENEYNTIKDYVINALLVYNIDIKADGSKQERTYKEYDDIVYSKQTIINEPLKEPIKPIKQNYQEHYVDNSQSESLSSLEQIQRKVSEFEKTLREKDERIKELERQALEHKLDSDVNTIVGQNLEILRDLNYLEKGSEKLMISRELKEVYKGLIKNVDPKYQSLKEKKEGTENTNESND